MPGWWVHEAPEVVKWTVDWSSVWTRSPVPCWVKVSRGLIVTSLSKVPPVAVGLERWRVMANADWVGAALDRTSQRELPVQPVTEIGEVLLKLAARTIALTVALPLPSKVVSASRSTTVSVLPSTLAGLVTTGTPVSVTVPDQAAEPVQK